MAKRRRVWEHCGSGPGLATKHTFFRGHGMKWWYIVLFSALACLLSCSRRGGGGTRTYASWTGGLIKHYGTYVPANSGVVIVVSKRPKALLEYVVTSDEGEVLIDSRDGPAVSVFHAWCIYWDNESQLLWVFNSDIGSFVWVRQDDAEYDVLYLADNKGFINMLPDAIFSTLHPSFQKRYAHRDYSSGADSNDIVRPGSREENAIQPD